MNLFDIYKEQGVNPVRDWQVAPPLDTGTFNLLGASMRLYNPLFSVHKSLFNLKQRTDFEYDSWDDIPEEFRTPDLIGSFTKANNKSDVMRISSFLRQEFRDRQILEGSGLTGIATSMFAGVTDPIQFLIPGSVVFRAAKSAGALRTAGRFALGATALAIPSEIALQQGVLTRTGLESTIDTIASGLFAGVIGAGVGALTKGLAKSQTKEISNILQLPERKLFQLPWPEGHVPEPPHVGKMKETLAFVRAGQVDLQKTINGLNDTIKRLEGVPGREAAVTRAKEQLQQKINDFKQGQGLVDAFERSIPRMGVLVPEEAEEVIKLLEQFKQRLLPHPEGTVPGDRTFTLVSDLESALKRSARPTISSSFPRGTITPQELVPRIDEGRTFDIIPRPTYDPPVMRGMIEQARRLYENWTGVMTFPGRVVDDADRLWLGRLLPHQDMTPPAFPAHHIYDALQESTLKQVRKIEKKIDSLVKQWQQKAEQAASHPTNAKLRNTAKKSARRIAREISMAEDQVSSLLGDVRQMDDLHQTLNMVEVERFGQRYFIPRDIIESDYKIHGTDGVKNPLDVDPDFKLDTSPEAVEEMVKAVNKGEVTKEQADEIIKEIPQLKGKITVFRGTTGKFDPFQVSPETMESAGDIVWFSNDPKIANQYVLDSEILLGTKIGSKVTRVTLNPKKTFDMLNQTHIEEFKKAASTSEAIRKQAEEYLKAIRAFKQIDSHTTKDEISRIVNEFNSGGEVGDAFRVVLKNLGYDSVRQKEGSAETIGVIDKNIIERVK